MLVMYYYYLLLLLLSVTAPSRFALAGWGARRAPRPSPPHVRCSRWAVLRLGFHS